MAKWHEPFTWRTIGEVLPMATDDEKDYIYEEILSKPSWNIAMVERIYAEVFA